MARLRFNSNGKGHGEVYIDDRRVFGLTKVTLVANPGEIDRLTIDILLLDGADIDREAGVHIHENSQETLVALGWTPPPVEDRTYHTIPK